MKRNIENIQKVLDLIEANPSCWDQSKWHCGTSHCFAGHAQIMLTGKENIDTVRRDARIFFGMSKAEADYYFAGNRTIDELKTAADEDLYNPAGYDRDGYDRAGYDRDGFDQDGFDWDGYDRDGYDRDGYDRAGYDRDGFDQDGFDWDGFDQDGFDSENNPKP
jgi:hypothetical protein